MRGEYANQTFFITQDPIPSWDCALLEAKIDQIAVFTDGIDKLVLRDRNKEVFAPFFDGVFKDIIGPDTMGRNRDFSRELSSFLASSRVNDLTDDDKTLIVAARSTG
jgi:hypothetical protein